jgi:hypothetical protein
VAGAETMPSLVGGNTEMVCCKLKSWKGILEPNFELGPSVISTLLSATCLALVVTWSGRNTIGI